MPDDHHHDHDADSVGFGVLTVSSSRTLAADPSGDAIVAAAEEAGHAVPVRDLVADDENRIRERIETLVRDAAVEAVVTSGGTGLTPDDVTVEGVRPLFDREIPGFGEQFRARSVAEVGPHAMISRATAGVAGGVPVFCLPGSQQAAEFGTTELVLPIAGHVVGLAGDGGHDHQHGDDHDHGHDHDHGGE
jgi:molybdenum cofactor biosynthesis protein B